MSMPAWISNLTAEGDTEREIQREKDKEIEREEKNKGKKVGGGLKEWKICPEMNRRHSA